MAGNRVRGGLLAVKVDGVTYAAVGNFTYNAGGKLRTALMGATGVDGYSEAPQAAFIAGEFRDGEDVDTEALVAITDATITLELANGKTFVLANAWFEGEGTGNSQEGNFAVRFSSDKPGTFV
ncbi:MAG: phage tail tube protein [Pseudomonas sp.]